MQQNQSSKSIIPVSSMRFSPRGLEFQYVSDVMNSGWLTQGKYVKRFEEEFATKVGAKYAVSCCNGTAALHLAMIALNVDENTTVIVPSLTYVATANAVKYCGGNIFFSDVRYNDWCMSILNHDPAYLSCERLIKLPVHLYDAKSVVAELLCHNVVDSAHYVGPNKQQLATHSFYASKVISCGEGGMITTNDEELADKMRLYRGQGATIPGQYHHSVVGYNYRMTELQAAIGLAQLHELDENLFLRRQVIDRYRHNLSGQDKIILQGGERASGWMFACLLSEDVIRSRDEVRENMFAAGIQTRPFFEPLHTLPMYSHIQSNCPIAESVSKRGICLPTYAGLELEEVDYICGKLMEIV